MNKLKTSKSIKKRFKLTSNGKFLRHRASRSHLLQKKSSTRKQSLRKTLLISPRDIVHLKCKCSYFL